MPTSPRPSLITSPSRSLTPQSNDFAPFSVNSGRTEYRRLLNNVIAAAKGKRGGFPARGAFNLDDLMNALPVSGARINWLMI